MGVMGPKNGKVFSFCEHIRALDIDGYLDRLSQEGSLNSRGAFTLDQAEALQKLQQFQILEPWEYISALVASAVASQATWVRIQAQPSSLRLEHNGRSISHGQLVSLFSSLLVSNPDAETAAVHELAFGLNALNSLNPSRLRVICSDSEGFVLLQLSSKQLLVTQAEPFETYGKQRRTTVHVEGLSGMKSKLLRGIGQAPELRVLRQRCLFTGIPVYWGEEIVKCESSFPEVDCVVKVGMPPALPFDWPKEWFPRQAEFAAYLGFGPDVPSSMTVVMQGLSYTVEDAGLPDGFCAIVYSQRLLKDLSHSGVVQNEAFEAVRDSLREICFDMLVGVAEHTKVFSTALFAQASASLLKEAHEARKCWNTELAERLICAARNLKGYS